jgi:hypothetical protein
MAGQNLKSIEKAVESLFGMCVAGIAWSFHVGC